MSTVTNQPIDAKQDETLEDVRNDVKRQFDHSVERLITAAQSCHPPNVRAAESQLASAHKKQIAAEAHVALLLARIDENRKDAEQTSNMISHLQKQLALHERMVRSNSDREQRLVELDKQCQTLLSQRVELEVTASTYKQRLEQATHDTTTHLASIATIETRCRELQDSKHQSDILLASIREKTILLETRQNVQVLDRQDTEHQKSIEIELQKRILVVEHASHEEQKRHDAKINELQLQFLQSQMQLERTLAECKTISATDKASYETAITAVKNDADMWKRESLSMADKVKSDTEASKRELVMAVENARLDAKEQHRQTNETLFNKLAQKGIEVESQKAMILLLEKQLDDAKKTSQRMLPSDQGNVGEAEIEEHLRRNLGGFMTVRNVSKGGHGHEMDLELISRDGEVRIRIDVKNAMTVAENQITRFHSDVDSIKPPPTAAILFMKQGIRGETVSNSAMPINITRCNRGSTMVIQIGWWATDLLIETAHDIYVMHKINVVNSDQSKKPFTGAAEVGKAFGALSNLVSFQNDQATKVTQAISDWKTLGAQKNRVAVDELRAAHSANTNAVPHEVLVSLEKLVPKRNRGRPPAMAKPKSVKVKPKRRKPDSDSSSSSSESDSDSSPPKKISKRR